MYLVVSHCSIASLVFQHINAVVVEASITMQYSSNICKIQSDIQPVVLHQLHAIYHMYSRNIHVTYISHTHIYIYRHYFSHPYEPLKASFAGRGCYLQRRLHMQSW